MDFFASEETYTHNLPPTDLGSEQWIIFKTELSSYDELVLQGKLVEVQVNREKLQSGDREPDMNVRFAEYQQTMVELWIKDWCIYRTLKDDAGKPTKDERVPLTNLALKKINSKFRSQILDVINQLSTAIEGKDESSDLPENKPETNKKSRKDGEMSSKEQTQD